MRRVKKILGVALMSVCLVGTSACGNKGGVSQSNAGSLYYDTIHDDMTDGGGAYYDNLHGCLYDICTSSATDNAFLTHLSSDGNSVEYAFNGNPVSYERHNELKDKMSVMTATELSEFELLAYAVYLDNSGNAYPSGVCASSQKRLVEYMQSVYADTDEISFRSALDGALSDYYGEITLPDAEGLSYENCGNFLGIGDNVLMSGLFGLGDGESVVSCYETKPALDSIRYVVTNEDGVSSDRYVNVNTYAGIMIGSKGTVIGYEYLSFPESSDCILRDIYYLVGGGCVNGVVADEDKPVDVKKADLLFFGEKSLGNFAESECYSVFGKMVEDFSCSSMSMTAVLDRDCGISLQNSVGVSMGSLFTELGYNGDTADVVRSSVGRTPLIDDKNFGDLYGWYTINVDTLDGAHTCSMEGFAILHSRDYGFSAENYLRVF